MQPWFKRTAIATAIIISAGTSVLAAAVIRSESKLHRNVPLHDHPVVYKTDAASIEHGHYLFETRGCTDCHGQDGGGRLFINDPETGMRVSGANISGAEHSPVRQYSAADWEHTIRHGVKPDGHPLMIMPSDDYARLSDEDLNDLVAYVRQLPAVEGMPLHMELPLMVRVLYGVDVIQDSADRIDHNLSPQPDLTPAATAEYGEYLAHACQGCHGAHLSGGAIPGAPPAWPASANLTPGDHSAMLQYASLEDFKSMLQTGKRVDGSAISNVMPFSALAQLNDTDIEALYRYLKTLAPMAAGNR